MLNAEKHKYEIAEADYDFGLYDDQCIDVCDYAKCPDCKFYNEFTGCRAERIRWLVENCEKPILNDSEKIILRDIVKAFEQFGYEIKYIGRYPWSEEENDFYLSFQDEHYNELISPTLYNKTSKMFKGMELEKDYTLEELGLNNA